MQYGVQTASSLGRECRAALHQSELLNVAARHKAAPTGQEMLHCCPTFSCLWSRCLAERAYIRFCCLSSDCVQRLNVCVQHVPTPEAMLQLSGRLAVYLDLSSFPLVDIGLLTSRYIIELNLPRMSLLHAATAVDRI